MDNIFLFLNDDHIKMENILSKSNVPKNKLNQVFVLMSDSIVDGWAAHIKL